MNNKDTASGGVGFCGLLTIVFIILKLCGVIAWGWWWVLAPLWIPIALVLTIILVAAVGSWISSTIDKWRENKK